MPDGNKRKRRQYNQVTRQLDKVRSMWYAKCRSERFNKRFGLA